ncbi:MAG: hypothetical protein HY321_12370 [Armatimonadetes bacterium]|nr:hypothetical protein [Armatimonadota bacterium]
MRRRFDAGSGAGEIEGFTLDVDTFVREYERIRKKHPGAKPADWAAWAHQQATGGVGAPGPAPAPAVFQAPMLPIAGRAGGLTTEQALAVLHRAGTQPGGAVLPAPVEETRPSDPRDAFVAAVFERIGAAGGDFTEAARLASVARPDLYAAYRQACNGHRR